MAVIPHAALADAREEHREVLRQATESFRALQSAPPDPYLAAVMAEQYGRLTAWERTTREVTPFVRTCLGLSFVAAVSLAAVAHLARPLPRSKWA